MNNVIESDIKIEDMIYEIRGVQVMLDSDLAKLYEVETKRINEAVKNNLNKFPERFSWQLSIDETIEISRSKFSTLNIKQGYNVKYGARVFTEQGVYMLATILKSKVATEVSIRIMDTFVNIRKFINDNKNIYKSINNINNKILEHDEKFNYLFSKFDKKEEVIIKGKVYDGYSLILKILSNAKRDVIIIDSYADYKLLDLIRNIKCSVILITKNSKRLSNIEIDKYNMEYGNLKVYRDNEIHDRYFVIDRSDIYLLGTSINSIGDKMTTIVKLQEANVINTINKMIKEIIKN